MFHDKLHEEHKRILEAIKESALQKRIEKKINYLIAQLGGRPDDALTEEAPREQIKGHDQQGKRTDKYEGRNKR